MRSCLGTTVSTCLRPFSRYARMSKDDDEDLGGADDALLWSRDLERHSHGEFSFAVVQANEVLEDQSQVETGRNATFAGVYDGHGGPEASRYICDHIFHHLLRLARENGKISEDVLRNVYSETENGFLTFVRRAYAIKHKIAAEQLTRDHNASMEEVRKEIRTLHPEDPQILVLKQGVWRIKGIIQVSRSIGDAYLKGSEFALDPSFPRFHLPEPLRRPVLRADPSVCTRDLRSDDNFVIFASDGFWEHLSNLEAVEIVHDNPRPGIARRLLVSALRKAAKTREVTYNEIKKLDPGVRRHVHDDITIVVIFIDHETLATRNSPPDLSVRGFVDADGPPNFNFE